MFNIQNAFNQCKAFDKGRWYTNFIESDGTDINLTSCELVNHIYITSTSAYLYVPINFHIVDYKVDINLTISSSSSFSYGKSANTGEMYLTSNIFHPSKFDYAYVYIFGYYDEPAQANTLNAAPLHANLSIDSATVEEPATEYPETIDIDGLS